SGGGLHQRSRRSHRLRLPSSPTTTEALSAYFVHFHQQIISNGQGEGQPLIDRGGHAVLLTWPVRATSPASEGPRCSARRVTQAVLVNTCLVGNCRSGARRRRTASAICRAWFGRARTHAT